VQSEELSDEDLLRKTVTQDKDAFRLLFERHKTRVYNVILRMIGSPEDAADLLQDVFLTVYTQAKSFRFQSRFATWLMSVTINATLNASKRKRRRRHVEVSEELAAEPRPIKDEKIRAVLDRLDPTLRAVVILRYIEGMDYAEIAQVVDCPTGTVKSRLHRAHEELREALRDELR
jgi:RNA polymerase sigma-70 factor (ECF subfamily)